MARHLGEPHASGLIKCLFWLFSGPSGCHRVIRRTPASVLMDREPLVVQGRAKVELQAHKQSDIIHVDASCELQVSVRLSSGLLRVLQCCAGVVQAPGAGFRPASPLRADRRASPDLNCAAL